MPPHHPIIVLADDLSGAAELAGIAFARGLSAEVRRVGPAIADRAGPPAEVIAIDTDSRHLSPLAAAERVKQIAEQVLVTHPAWLFKKVDSVLRGNPRAEIEAILDATGQSRALLIPANPSRGRIIRDGRYLIDGIPLDQTPFADDPQHPRFSSDVFTLLGAGTADITIPDLETNAQLEKLAAQCDPIALPAGAADYFAALLNVRCKPSHSPASTTALQLPPPVLLVCGSSAAWAQRQETCAAAGIPWVTIDQRPQPQLFTALLLGPGNSGDSQRLSKLAQTAADLVRRLDVETLLAEGGATAAALADQLAWSRFAVVATAPAGVGVLQLLAPSAPIFIIKPGSYPWPSEIWDAFCKAGRSGP